MMIHESSVFGLRYDNAYVLYLSVTKIDVRTVIVEGVDFECGSSIVDFFSSSRMQCGNVCCRYSLCAAASCCCCYAVGCG